MLFVPPHVKTNSSTSTVTGYRLALNKMSAAERAFVAAKLVLGQMFLIEPRVTQAARLAGTSVQYVKAAIDVLRYGPKFEIAVCEGTFPLLEAAVMAKHPEPTLAEKFQTATAAEIAVFAKDTGPALLWDECVAPFI